MLCMSKRKDTLQKSRTPHASLERLLCEVRTHRTWALARVAELQKLHFNIEASATTVSVGTAGREQMC